MVELLNRLRGAVASETAAPIAERPAFDRLRARLKDPVLEAAYHEHLVRHELPREQILWCLMFLVYLSYGILDYLTMPEHWVQSILVRVSLVSFMAVTAFPITNHPRLRRYFGYISILGGLLMASSIIWMISIIPNDGPPYIVGILIVFTFASCVLHMPFLPAAGSYLVISVAYGYVLLNDDKFSYSNIISGLFFMASSAGVATVTSYVQETRFRLVWAQNRQRRLDAARIENLMIEATAADQSKLNFLSILSHELRTPIHQIIGYSELARTAAKRAEPVEFEESIRNINAGAAKLLSLFGKMLRYADATAGRLRYDLDWHSVKELIDLSIDPYRSTIEKKQITVFVELQEKMSILIDQASFSYALGHLIENALEASPERARLWIRSALRADRACEIEIVDQGRGMTKAQIANAFAPFEQAGSARTRSSEGLGLGLAIARKIFHDQSAAIQLESSPGEGCTARVTISPAHVRTAIESVSAISAVS